uniref:Nudix hydrolase domain-containing protein n=2 Tax=Ditylenchus dipsaci TaxID=166011 RepID=A0A915DYS0_9BILA
MLNFSYKVRGRCLIVSHHEKETPRKRTFGTNEDALYSDMALEKESVMVFIYHRVDKRIILVKQFRPTVNGDVIEMCAGLMDKNKTPVETAKEEILEECGYDVQLEDIIHLKTYLTGIGISGPPQYLFYCEVDESMKAADGGGLKEEGNLWKCEIIFFNTGWISITIEEAREMLNEKEVNSPSSVLYAISWFLQNKINVP